MKATQTDTRYVEWLNTEVMHKASINWLSELLFIKKEQLFFDHLIKSYPLQLLESKHFAKSKKVIDRLHHLQKMTDTLIEKVKKHERGLKITVDKLKEENYKKEHRNLIILVSEFFELNKALKKQLFKLIKSILKEKKQKLLPA